MPGAMVVCLRLACTGSIVLDFRDGEPYGRRVRNFARSDEQLACLEKPLAKINSKSIG